MAAFTVAYIQLTALQVGARYRERDLIVMSESLEDLKAIIDNAPASATIVDIIDDGTVDFLYVDKKAGDGEKIRSCINGGDGAIEYSDGDIRSLSDIKRIIELMEWQQSALESHPNIDIDMENL